MMKHAHRLKIGHDRPAAALGIVVIERNQMIDLAPGRRHVAVRERTRAIGSPNERDDAGTWPIRHRRLRRSGLAAMTVGKDAASTLGLFGDPRKPPCDEPVADRLLPQYRDCRWEAVGT